MNYSKFEGKLVVVEYNDEADPEQIHKLEGTVLRGSQIGLLIRDARGRQPKMIEAELIIAVDEKIKPVRLIRRLIAEPTDDSVRQHLADRHGFTLSSIPASGEEALKVHGTLDHRLLGHDHGSKPARRSNAAEEVVARTEALESVDIQEDFQ